jgi:hypothetical protein
MASANWKWPIPGRQLLAGTAGRLTFVGGAGDFDAKGMVRHSGDPQAQVAGSMANLAGAVVPQPHMHTKDMTVEIWGVAQALAR